MVFATVCMSLLEMECGALSGGKLQYWPLLRPLFKDLSKEINISQTQLETPKSIQPSKLASS